MRSLSASSAPGFGVEEVQRPDHLGTQPHRHRVYRGEADLGGGGGEPRPAAGGGQVGDRDRLAGAEAVHARPLVGLQLEQLQQPGAFGGRGHHLQRVLPVGQQQPGRRDAQQLHTSLGQHVQEVDHVEIVDESIGHLDEHVG